MFIQACAILILCFYIHLVYRLHNRIKPMSGSWGESFFLTQVLLLCSVVVISICSHLIFKYIHFVFVNTGVLLIGYILASHIGYTRKAHVEINAPIGYFYAPTIVVVLVALGVILANTVRAWQYEGSIVTLGTNDDNANHIAFSALSIKENQLLMNNTQVNRMVESGMYSDSTHWYPLGLYTTVQNTYRLIATAFGDTNPLNVSMLFNIHNTVVIQQAALLIWGVFILARRIYSPRTILSLSLIVLFGVFVVSGQFFMRLFLYGFHSQLVGYNILIGLIVFVDHCVSSKSAKNTYLVMIGMCIFVVNVTYYLFVPLTFISLLLFHHMTNDRKCYFLYPVWVVGCIPMIYFHLRHAIDTQLSSYGVSFVDISGFVLCLVSLIVVVVLKKGINTNLRTLLVVLVGLTLVQMTVVGAINFLKMNNLTYYFFKSYWTLGALCLPMTIACMWNLIDRVDNGSAWRKVAVHILLLIISCAATYSVFSQPGMDKRGYDTVLYVFSGVYNYFDSKEQKKMTTVYNNWKETRGKTIYPIGMWGMITLSYAIYGDTPNIYKNFFANSQYHINTKNILALIKDIDYAETIGLSPIVNDPRHYIKNILPPYSEYGKKLKSSLERE